MARSTGYISFIFASSSLPGVPVWETPPEVIKEILLDSLDFFFINSGLTALGLSAIPAPTVKARTSLCAQISCWPSEG